MKESSGNKLIANNKKAYYDYFIDEKYEAGLVLHGTEVKSLRQGKCSIKEAYIQIINGEVFVINMNITPYEKEIFLIKTRFVRKSCSFISLRLINLRDRRHRRDLQ